ncbi:MAG: hypothetical protein Q9202_000658 [Teloschistes flavicans]
MAETSHAGVKDAAKDALPVSQPKSAGNPVFRMMGLPNFRFKLPSRNWLIFLSVTGSFTTAVLYDRYHKQRSQQRWCNLVSHIAQEPLPPNRMPRRITIFLSAPPGDSLRAAREHFHEYVKPVLVAGAMDWDVIEGRREGDVRAGLAEKIRKRRRKEGEKPTAVDESEDPEEKDDLVQQLRDTVGITESEGVQGDLILGRHTWKEYVRGLHEGWLGPLNPPPDPTPVENTPESSTDPPALEDATSTTNSSPEANDSIIQDSDSKPPPEGAEKPKEEKKEEKPKKAVQSPPHIPPTINDYNSARLPPSIPETLPPCTVLPSPHILGFLNTPIRIYRFLNRRYLADETGREVAALVLASHMQAWKTGESFASSADPDASPSTSSSAVIQLEGDWEQQRVLQEEERDWHKSVWKASEDEQERILKTPILVEPRIGGRMTRFEIGAEEYEKAKSDEGKDPAAQGLLDRVKEMVGWEEDTAVKGWEHGFVGVESA